MCRPKFLQPSDAPRGSGPALVGFAGHPPPPNPQQIRPFGVADVRPPYVNPNAPSYNKGRYGQCPPDPHHRRARSPCKAGLHGDHHRASVHLGSRSCSPPARAARSGRVVVPRDARSLSPANHVRPLPSSASQASTSDGEVTALQRGIASCTGTVFMSAFMTPLDVVKVRLQAQQQPSNTVIRSFRPVFDAHPPSVLNLVPYRRYTSIPATHSHSHLLCESPASMERFGGTVDAFVKIVRNEGLGRLWSGLTPALIMRIPSNVIYFSVYEKLKSSMGFQAGRTDKNSVLITLTASGTARAISVTTVSPIEMIRTKMQAEPMSYAQLSQCLRQAIQVDGLSSLWRGLCPMLSRDVMYAILYWTGYELLKAEMCKVSHTDKPTVSMTFWAGASSGVLAAVVSTPFDVVKTQKQITIGKAKNGVACGGTTSWAIMRALFAEAGLRGLFAGTLPRICKGAPSSAILITTYECVLAYFRKYNQQSGYL